MVFVWAHGGQAPEEMALGLFSCLGTLCLASKAASVLALRTKTQLKSRSGTCLSRDAAGWRGSRAQRGWGAAWRGAHASCATAHWECSLWQPLGPCCRGAGGIIPCPEVQWPFGLSDQSRPTAPATLSSNITVQLSLIGRAAIPCALCIYSDFLFPRDTVKG